MASDPVATVEAASKRFTGASKPAVDELSLRVEAGRVTGVVGADGAGKTTLMRLLAGLLLPDQGRITICGHDTRGNLDEIRRSVSYMPQRFGLYEDLSVLENLRLYASLRGVIGQDARNAFDRLLTFTNLSPFTSRLAGQLSGGMKQKLGLACALIGTPRLLLLDEPGVGVDPISRRELWKIVYQLVSEGLAVVWSTAYLDEADRCQTVLLLNEGKALYTGPPRDFTHRVAGRAFLIDGAGPARRTLLATLAKRPDVVDAVIQGASIRLVLRTQTDVPSLLIADRGELSIRPVEPRFEDAFIDLLGGIPEQESLVASGRSTSVATDDTIIEATNLTKTFGNFVAADRISFRIRRGEVFGLLGPNGAGKSTTFKMMCGLLRPTSGLARVAGLDLYLAASSARARLGYMAQKFSLYGDLSVSQNLEFFAGIYGLSRDRRRNAIGRMVECFGFTPYLRSNAGALPLGFKQRLALACAVLHEPEVLFLDEPTSGVDPLTRREFWSHINALVAVGVTVMVTTHFLDEAEYCDRVGLVYRGRIIAEGSPDSLKNQAKVGSAAEPTLEESFITLVENYDRHGAAHDHAA